MIEIKGLTFSYTKNKKLFNNLEIQFISGRTYGLLGKNGAGKTTLLKIIAGLLCPHKGYCKIDNIDTFQREPSILQKLYIIPEEFELPPIKIKNFIKVNSPFYSKFSYEKFTEILKEFEVDVDEKLDSLSYGQKKKFLLAFGISTNSEILLMDEPTNGLDIPSKAKFRKVISSNLSEDRCIIISTHQIKDVENIIDTITIIDNGKIIFNYSTDDISKKLLFKEIEDHRELDLCIYSESIFSKKFGIFKNSNKDYESRIDLELLFNAVINDHMKINDAFNN